MKKTNIVLVILLIILLSVVIGLVLVIKHLSFEKKEPTIKEKKINEIQKEEIPSLIDNVENESITPETNDNSQSTGGTTVINNYYYITNYIDNAVDHELEEGNESRIKSTYNVLTDFIFNGGTIKGYTFNELTTEAKEKIMNTYHKIDNYIESKFPNYKSNIKDKAIEIKDKAIDKYHEINTEENRQEVKETYEDIKEKVSPYAEEIKDSFKEEVESAKEDYKSIYDIFKNWLNKDKETTE